MVFLSKNKRVIMDREKLETMLNRQNAEEMVKWLRKNENTDRNHVDRLTLPAGPFYEWYDTVILGDGLDGFQSTILQNSEIKGPSIDEIKKLKEHFGFPGSSGGWMSSDNVSVHSFSIGHAQDVIKWLVNVYPDLKG